MTARVTGVFVYPLKSAGGISLPAAELDAFGLRWDRRWMVVDDHGIFVTQRDEPRLALIRTRMGEEAFELEAPEAGPFSLPLRSPSAPRRRVAVWDDVTDAVDVGAEAADWISRAIGRPARILFFPDDGVRPVDPTFASDEDRVSFSDGFPLLLISQASLDALNSRLETPLPMNRFRPNIVVDATTPHAEDGWREITIGDVPCLVVKPCRRCVTTTVDQDTGATGKEPLRTLATYRKVGSGVEFGMNVIHRGRGVISVGDAVVTGQ